MKEVPARSPVALQRRKAPDVPFARLLGWFGTDFKIFFDLGYFYSTFRGQEGFGNDPAP